jgi:hypothetical protein
MRNMEENEVGDFGEALFWCDCRAHPSPHKEHSSWKKGDAPIIADSSFFFMSFFFLPYHNNSYRRTMGQPDLPPPCSSPSSSPASTTADRPSPLVELLSWKNALLIVIVLLMLLALGLLIVAAIPGHGIFPLTISLAALPKSFLHFPYHQQQQQPPGRYLRGSQQQVFPTTSITNGGQVVGGVPWPVPRYANPDDPATQEAYGRQSVILLSTAVVAVSSYEGTCILYEYAFF